MAHQRVGRRELMQATAAVGVGAMLPGGVWAQEKEVDEAWKGGITRYLEGLAKEDGGYGFEGQIRGHLTPTWAVIGCYRLLGEKVPRAKEVAEFVRTHHPRALKGRLAQELRQFEWQQVQSLVWLDEDPSSFRELVQSFKAPVAYLRQYERHGYPVFQQEVTAILCYKLLGLPTNDVPSTYVDYLNSRRRENGSFNNTPASDGSDGNILNTWWGLQALEALGRADEKKAQTIEWLQKCKVPGGFTHQPKPEIGAVEDVAYTWAAVRSLALLGARPNEDSVIDLQLLRTTDGGFADRKGWLSNPLATYYALDALATLGALKERPQHVATVQRPTLQIPSDLKVFSIQIESHGQGSPAEAVDLADQLKIHLWGAKNAKPEWLKQAQALANEQGIGTEFFVANEEYGTWIDVPGMGTYSHMSDVIGPANVDLGPSLANAGVLSWPDFAHRRLGRSRANIGVAVLPDKTGDGKGVLAIGVQGIGWSPGRLGVAGGKLIWQFGENEPLVRMLLDDSLQTGGFAAISTYHFGNPDFTNTEPFLMRYRGVLPFVALQDAHGVEPWWFADMTEGFRTLFLARQPTWEAWLEALKNNWVVSVRHDEVSVGKTWMHGLTEVIEIVKDQWKDWQWWDNPAIERPMVSVVALTAKDQLEVGRPEKGVAVRLRCAMTNTTQGLPKTPIAEFVKLMVAGNQVQPEHIVNRRPNGAVEDDYYLYAWPEAQPGRYTATATVRKVAGGKEITRSIGFRV